MKAHKKEGYYRMAENDKLELQVEASAQELETTPETPSKKDKADKKADKKPAKKAKPGLFSRIAQWFRETKAELKKVQWPTWKQTMNNTLIVIAFCIVVGLCIFLFDKVAEGLFVALRNLFH